jgi:molybdate transport system ATP-binding protein
LGALDAGLRRRILPYLARVGEEFRIPTLFVSHDPAEVLALCDEVVLLEAGRIVRGGPPAVVLREQDSGLGAFENIFHGEVVQADEGTALLQLAEGGQVSVAARGIQIGERVLFSIRSDEILVALERPTSISARNVLPAVVIAVVEDGTAGVRVDARLNEGRGALLSAVLSAAAVRELSLRAGAALYLIFKANSCRLFTSQP